MAKEIRGASASGTLYARIMNRAGQWWNGATFEAYSAGNYANYDVAMTEEGSSGVYVADFPTGITTGGTYQYFVHRQSGGSPAQGDFVLSSDRVDWTGTTSVSATSGSMTGPDFLAYILRRGFKRTDKDTELYEAMTDSIQIMRRRFAFDEAMEEKNTTDTISVLGDYRLSVESDMGLLLGVKMLDAQDGHSLIPVNKGIFDDIYPDISVTADRGYPKHFTIYGGNILIGPIPDNTSYLYRKSYSLRAGTITSSTTGVPFTNLYRDVLADLVLSRAYHDLEAFELSDRYLGRFEQGFLESARRERANRAEGTFAVRAVEF